VASALRDRTSYVAVGDGPDKQESPKQVSYVGSISIWLASTPTS
jgi:hypothetical protein